MNTSLPLTPTSPRCTAFAGPKKIGTGTLLEVATKAKKHADKHPTDTLLIFDDTTSALIELDLRGTPAEVNARLTLSIGGSENEKTGPGRPKLGVVSREIGLLPRHWEWLALQPGGASVTLRKLVEEAKKQNADKDQIRLAQNAAYKFMSAMAGDYPHFEDASRAFFAGKKSLFETLTAAWPSDVREHILRIGSAAFHSA